MISPRIRLAAVLAILAVALSACLPDRNSYASFQHPGFPDDASPRWPYGQFLAFPVSHPDSLVLGDLIVALRYDTDIPLVSVALEVTYTDGKHERVDTVTLALSDTVGGIASNPRLSPSRQAEATVRRIRHHSGDHPVKVRHVMRLDTVRGISDVGIMLVNTSPIPSR